MTFQSKIFKPTLKFSQKMSVSNMNVSNDRALSINVLYCNANNTVQVHYNVHCNAHCNVNCSVHRTEHCTIEITVQSCNSCIVSTRLCCTTLYCTTLHCRTALLCTALSSDPFLKWL